MKTIISRVEFKALKTFKQKNKVIDINMFYLITALIKIFHKIILMVIFLLIQMEIISLIIPTNSKQMS